MGYDLAALRRDEFPITERFAYFNNCGIAPLPARSVRAVRDYTENFALNGSVGEKAWFPCVERTRAKLARFLNVGPDEIAFVKNTSEGMTIVAQAVPWQRGDVALVAQGEFPATIYPWRGLEEAGVELRFAANPSERITPETFAPALAEGNVRLVTLSWVQFHTGWRADIAAIGDLCRRHGALLCLDAIQGLGGLPLDLQATPVDFCVFGGNKWMLSLQGGGTLYVSRAARERLLPANVGWLGVAWPTFERFDTSLPLAERAARYEEGTRANICIASLEQALDLLNELGPANIAAHIRRISDLMVEGLGERGAAIRSQRDGDHWSGIVAWDHPGRDLPAIAQALEADGVILSVREGSLRAAPHCYNDESDVERLLEALDRTLKS